jgi:hypothetical protein
MRSPSNNCHQTIANSAIGIFAPIHASVHLHCTLKTDAMKSIQPPSHKFAGYMFSLSKL